MQSEIIKTENNKFALFINGKLHAEYTRKSSAQKRLNAFLEKEADCAALAGAAQATLANAAQTPPASNTGGLKQGSFSSPESSLKTENVKTENISEKTSQFVMVNGKIKEIPLRKGNKTAAHIDTFTLVVHKEVFVHEDLKIDDEHPENIQQLAAQISQTLLTIFGFGLTEQKNGLNGYKYSFAMKGEHANYGVAAFGGIRQKDSIMIYLYGEGLTAALDGWENRLYNWITAFAPFSKFTRVDLAHDFINGEFTPNDAEKAWLSGGFTQAYTRPNSRKHGWDWQNEQYPDGKQHQRSGKTFYVGSETSSRMVRVYDKGCELGDKTSNWTRFELQLRNRDYLIPHEILIAPGEYLTAAYPICQEIFSEFQEDLKKMERIEKEEMINLAHVVYYASQAASPCINVLEQLGFSDEEIKILLKGGKFAISKRLGADKHDCREANLTYIHEIKEIVQEVKETRINRPVKTYLDRYRDEVETKKRFERLDQSFKSAELYKMERDARPYWLDF